MVRRKNENAPLLLDDLSPNSMMHRSVNSVHIQENPNLDDIRHRSSATRIMIFEALLIVLEYLQYFALLQSLSLRWTWPLTWTRSLSFLFIFNLDIWELAKVSSGSYTAARDAFVPSENVPINYRVMLLIWLLVHILITCVFAYLRWKFMQKLYSKALGILKHCLIIAAQVLALPIGIQIGKIFWCVPSSNTMDVANTVVCWQGEHIAYILVGLLVAIAVFILYPIWLIRGIKFEVISSNARKHEGYLQLKHCEYIFDLDTSWIDRQFLSFGSFRRFWVYHKPINHIFKLIILCFYAGLFYNRLVQASLVFASFIMMLVVCMIRLPYRVTSFNIALLWSWLCLCCNSVIGAMQNIPGIQSAFLLPSYIEGELILINVAWLIGTALFIVYFALRLQGIICANVPLWPSMLHHGMDGLNKNTRRYMVAAINGKSAVKQALSCPALLAPVHLLAHHIQVVNALACEAEYINDPLHSTLRDSLDDLIDLHSKLVPQSIFTESLKVNVQSTVTNLMEVLPAFTKRLSQRQFDFILVSPVRRRLLLKMFAMSCFIRGRQQQPAHEPGVRKLWTAPDSRHLTYDEGFHEDSEEESIINVDHIEINEADERLTVSHHSFGTYNFPAEVPGPSTTDV